MPWASRARVRAVAGALQRLDETGALARHLAAPRELPPAVREEEATILGMQDPAELQAVARTSLVRGG